MKLTPAQCNAVLEAMLGWEDLEGGTDEHCRPKSPMLRATLEGILGFGNVPAAYGLRLGRPQSKMREDSVGLIAVFTGIAEHLREQYHPNAETPS